jgi:hypothetical protein
VIGERARNVDADHTLDHVVGVMVFNDISARDLQLANNQWTGGKAIDTFAPCGPVVVTLEEIENIQALPVRTRVNGNTVQDGNTADMIFGSAFAQKKPPVRPLAPSGANRLCCAQLDPCERPIRRRSTTPTGWRRRSAGSG